MEAGLAQLKRRGTLVLVGAGMARPQFDPESHPAQRARDHRCVLLRRRRVRALARAARVGPAAGARADRPRRRPARRRRSTPCTALPAARSPPRSSSLQEPRHDRHQAPQAAPQPRRHVDARRCARRPRPRGDHEVLRRRVRVDGVRHAHGGPPPARDAGALRRAVRLPDRRRLADGRPRAWTTSACRSARSTSSSRSTSW